MATEPRTLCDIFSIAASSGKPNLLISKVGGVWKPISATDFGFTVRALSLGLNGLGLQPGDRAAILAENRPEWAMADYAVLCAGAWSVPIYPTLPALPDRSSPERLRAKAIFVSTLEQLGKILTIKAQCPTLDHVILIDGNPPGEPGYTTFHAVVDRGRPTLEMSPTSSRSGPGASRPRTSRPSSTRPGTTGEPKGVDADPLEHRLQRGRRAAGHPVHGGRDRPLVPPALARVRAHARLRLLLPGPPRSPTPSRSTSWPRTSRR